MWRRALKGNAAVRLMRDDGEGRVRKARGTAHVNGDGSARRAHAVRARGLTGPRGHAEFRHRPAHWVWPPLRWQAPAGPAGFAHPTSSDGRTVALRPPPKAAARILAWEAIMARRYGSICIALLAGSMLAVAFPALIPVRAADVTPERLANPPEPQNWLMNHRTYDGQRFSPLDKNQQGERQELEARLWRSSLGGGGTRGYNEAATRGRWFPLSLQTSGAWSTRSTPPAAPLAASPGVWIPSRASRRPIAALPCGAIFVISVTNQPARVVVHRQGDSGKVVWETNNVSDQPAVRPTAAPLAIRDKIIVGAAFGDAGARD